MRARPLSLRTRLIVGVIALAAVGLVAADVATYSSLKSFLLQRVDSALESGHAQVERENDGDEAPRRTGRGIGRAILDRGGPPAAGVDWVEVRTLGGTVVSSSFLVGGGSPPKLPRTIAIPARPGPHGERTTYFTVASKDGRTSYRVRASIEPQVPNHVLVIAASLHDVTATLHRLLFIELLATAAVLAALAVLGLWVVRVSLRPLAAIGATAAKIADGDLSQRIEREDERTEVGRLGRALNAMLAQIETGYRAREASEAKLRRFVADASHELRTPLAAVRAYAELFGRGAAERPVDLERSMRGIARESERMSLLVEDLLLLARLDEGRPLEREPVQLDELVREAVDAAHAVDPERPLETALEPAVVLGDRDRLRQVVDNLLSNVRAHTPAATPVHVSVGRRNGSAVVEVADEGPGLDEEHAEHVFERFYRTDGSRTRASGGVGLGLAIVAAVVDAHGGTAAIESARGAGTTVRIELPLR